MKKKMRIFACAMAFFLLAATIAGCADTSGNGEASPGIVDSPSADAGASAESSPDMGNLAEQTNIRFPKRELGGNKNITVMVMGEDDWLRAATSVYQAEYGGTVSFVSVAWDMRITRLRQYVMSGDSPDYVSVFGVDILSMMFQDLLTPIGDLIDLENENLRIDAMKKLASYKGNIYGFAPVPQKEQDELEQSPLVMIYNNNLFRRASLKTPLEYYNEGNWTWEVFLDLARKITEKDNSGQTTTYGFAGSYDEAFIISNGVPPASYENDTVTLNLNNNESRAAFDIVHDMVADGVSPLERWDGYALFLGGNLAMYHAWPNEVGNYISSGMDVDFVPFPKGPAADNHYSLGDFSFYAVPMGAKNVEGGLAFCEILANGFPNLEREKRPFTEEQKERMSDIASSIKDGGFILGNSGPLAAEWNQLYYSLRLNPVGTALESELPALNNALNTFLSIRK